MAKEHEMSGTEEVMAAGTSDVVETTEETVSKTEKKELIFRRKKVGSKRGNEFWAYYVSGTIRGKEKTADFVAKDTGGYELLEDIFSINPEPRLRVTYSKMGDALTKQVNEFASYEVYAMDPELDVEITCGVRPLQDSDKSILKVLLVLLAKQQ